MLNRIKVTYNEFPNKFWVLVGAMFVDRVGGTLIFPFFTLYITQKFSVGMTQAGILLGIFSFSSMVGNILGGALADRFGRKGMVLFGLIFSALSSVTMGLVNELTVFYMLAVIVGLLSDVAGPAWQAMIADILPEEQRTEGFGVLRVVGNMAWIVGPIIGGFVATRSYLLLFILDAISSLITAAIIYRMIPETKPEPAAPDVVVEERETIIATFVGYGKVLTDGIYMGYIVVSMLMLLVYLQMYSTLGVFLRDTHGIPEQGYGFVLTSSAITVILFQFWVTRRVKKYPPMLMMALGSAFYLVGFSMYGFVSAYALFITAMVLITIGEMIVMPVSQALAAKFAPEDMRGRFMAIFSLAWAVPSTVGATAAGLIMDNYNPNWVWHAAGIICTIAVLGFFWLHRATRERFRTLEVSEEAATV